MNKKIIIITMINVGIFGLVCLQIISFYLEGDN